MKNLTQNFLQNIVEFNFRATITTDCEGKPVITITDPLNASEITLAKKFDGKMFINAWSKDQYRGDYYLNGWNLNEDFCYIEQLLDVIDAKQIMNELNK